MGSEQASGTATAAETVRFREHQLGAAQAFAGTSVQAEARVQAPFRRRGPQALIERNGEILLDAGARPSLCL
jgi:hypothetical protein